MTPIHWKTTLILVAVVIVQGPSSSLAADITYDEYVLEFHNHVHIPCRVNLIEHAGLGDLLKGLEGKQLEEVVFSKDVSEMLEFRLDLREHLARLTQIQSLHNSLYDKVRDKPQAARQTWYALAVSKCS